MFFHPNPETTASVVEGWISGGSEDNDVRLVVSLRSERQTDIFHMLSFLLVPLHISAVSGFQNGADGGKEEKEDGWKSSVDLIIL